MSGRAQARGGGAQRFSRGARAGPVVTRRSVAVVRPLAGRARPVGEG